MFQIIPVILSSCNMTGYSSHVHIESIESSYDVVSHAQQAWGNSKNMNMIFKIIFVLIGLRACVLQEGMFLFIYFLKKYFSYSRFMREKLQIMKMLIFILY